MFKKLLDDIVAKDVRHERVSRGQNLVEDHFFFGRAGPFQFLLDEPRTVLVLRKLNHVIGQVAQLYVWKSIVPKETKQPSS